MHRRHAQHHVGRVRALQKVSQERLVDLVRLPQRGQFIVVRVHIVGARNSYLVHRLSFRFGVEAELVNRADPPRQGRVCVSLSGRAAHCQR